MDEKELVRQKTDMVTLVGSVVSLKQAGANFKGLCPFHHEKSPSFMVNPELGIFKCFGCGEGGDCFAWMMKTEGMSFGEALRYLAKEAGVKLSGRIDDKADSLRQEVLECLAMAGRFYHYLLTKHKVGDRAKEYLLNRGVSFESMVEFGLGWAPDDWDGLQRALGSKGVRVEIMEQAGLVMRRESGGYYDRFRGRVMFELRNGRGQVVGVAGRILDPKTEAPKYINSPETSVYHKGELLYGLDLTKNEVRNSKKIIIVEGELDMISSYQSGVKNVVALKGTALTDAQVSLVKRYAEEVILALDMDFAGDKAARRGIGMAEKAGLSVKMVRLPEGKDPDDIAREDEGLWQKLVKDAIDVYEFWLDSSLERYDVSSGYGKKKIFEELIPLWREIDNEILQAHWVGELARRTGVDENLVWRQMRSVRDVMEMGNEERVENDGGELETVMVVVGWYLQNDIEELKKSEWKELIDLVWFGKMIKYLEKNKWDKDNLPAEISDNVEEAMMRADLVGLKSETAKKWRNVVFEKAINKKILKLKLSDLDDEKMARESGRLNQMKAGLR